MSLIAEILQKSEWNKNDIVTLLKADGDDKKMLFEQSKAIKKQYVDDIVYFRGLIEFSNICKKDCYYCGIRSSNKEVQRYTLSDEEILSAAQFAYTNRFGSIVLQSGEITSPAYVKHISSLIREINRTTDNKLRITLSLGEQSKETYQEWFESGAQRYLLRIETSSPELYRKMHPDDENHRHDIRLKALIDLKEIGYQLGTGVMIGLPFQTIEVLADDLLFMKNMDIHMVGMGPYIEHHHTPLFALTHQLIPAEERFQLTLKMIAVLRIMMKDINIAATTALQSIDKIGREKAIKIGANVIMPNITPGKYRDSYKLYDNKPCTEDSAEDCTNCMDVRISLANNTIAYGEWGDSKHFVEKTSEL